MVIKEKRHLLLTIVEGRQVIACKHAYNLLISTDVVELLEFDFLEF